jgi:hypothetical protein
MPLPPELELEPLDAPPMPLLPELELEPEDAPPIPLLPPELEEAEPALPRVPADVDPALRLAVLDVLPGTEATLLPADAELTSPATEADLAVAALTRADASAADLLVAATPPPVPAACPDTAEREASSAVLREAACELATVDGPEPLVVGGGE